MMNHPADIAECHDVELFREALRAVERDAVSNSLAVQQQRPVLADRSKPFVQRFDDGDREPLTWFHSRVVPVSPLGAIFVSVAKRIRTFDATTGRAAVVLMRRYSDHTGLAITTFMVHRLFLAALVVASKAHHDHVVRNRDFARVAGVDSREMYRMELALCVGVDWRTVVFDLAKGAKGSPGADVAVNTAVGDSDASANKCGPRRVPSSDDEDDCGSASDPPARRPSAYLASGGAPSPSA